MGDRLCYTVEQQADAHSGTEEHREPGEVAVRRLLIILAQPHLPVAAKHQPQHEDQEDADRQCVEPAKLRDDEVLHIGKRNADRFVEHGARDHEQEDERGGGEENVRVDFH